MGKALSIDDVGTPPSMRLTQQDVARLLKDPSPDVKIDILTKVSDHYYPQNLTDKERELAEQIFRLLVRDSAVRIREALSENLKSNPHVPHDIVLALAHDPEHSVAMPVLSMSQVLTEDDVVNIVQNSKEIWRYLAISKRPVLSERVSAVLVDTKHREVIHSVLDNKGAAFSENTLNTLTAEAYADKRIAEKLADRPRLPLTVVEKLMAFVSEEISHRLQKKYDLDPAQIAQEAHRAREQSTLSLIAIRSDRAETERLIRQLHENGRLTASLVINALCHGNLDFFEYALSTLANVPVENARVLLADKGRLGFKAVYEKAKLPETMFEAVQFLLRSVRSTLHTGVKPRGSNFSNQVIRHLIEMTETEEIDNLSYILALLRQQGMRPAY